LINNFTVIPVVRLRLTDVDVGVKLLTWIKTMYFKGFR